MHPPRNEDQLIEAVRQSGIAEQARQFVADH